MRKTQQVSGGSLAQHKATECACLSGRASNVRTRSLSGIRNGFALLRVGSSQRVGSCELNEFLERVAGATKSSFLRSRLFLIDSAHESVVIHSGTLPAGVRGKRTETGRVESLAQRQAVIRASGYWGAAIFYSTALSWKESLVGVYFALNRFITRTVSGTIIAQRTWNYGLQVSHLDSALLNSNIAKLVSASNGFGNQLTPCPVRENYSRSVCLLRKPQSVRGEA